MNNYAEYITPEKAKELGDTRTLEEIRDCLKSRKKCIVCKAPTWKYGGQDMCFTCTTGEADASEDCELVGAE